MIAAVATVRYRLLMFYVHISKNKSKRQGETAHVIPQLVSTGLKQSVQRTGSSERGVPFFFATGGGLPVLLPTAYSDRSVQDNALNIF